jgi:hypothetical protein
LAPVSQSILVGPEVETLSFMSRKFFADAVDLFQVVSRLERAVLGTVNDRLGANRADAGILSSSSLVAVLMFTAANAAHEQKACEQSKDFFMIRMVLS